MSAGISDAPPPAIWLYMAPFLFTSKSPVSGFIKPTELLSNGDACGMHYIYKDKIYLFISNYSGNGWREYTYEVAI